MMTRPYSNAALLKSRTSSASLVYDSYSCRRRQEGACGAQREANVTGAGTGAAWREATHAHQVPITSMILSSEMASSVAKNSSAHMM